MSFILRPLKTWLLIGSVAVGLVLLVVYLGFFNVAADVPHSAFVLAAMELVRDRSIAVRLKDVRVPPLDDPKLVAEGAEHYAGMCVDCHRAPGVKASQMREGLYPQPPDLTEHFDAGPAEEFWVIKHGIKMSAMPAWGKTHDDQSIWGIVAFLQRLPQLSPDQYRALVGAGRDDDHHDHHHDTEDEHGDHGTGHSHHHQDAAPNLAPAR
jgi:mono/diheme cytochrome c family protein